MLMLILCCAVLWLTYTICLVIYRLTLHPLAKFPGPRLTAATKWWEFYLDIISGEGGGFMYEVDRMHDKYGPIVRINPDEIHVRDPSWLDTLYPGPGTVKLLPPAQLIPALVLTELKVRDRYGPAAHVAGVPDGVFGAVDHNVHRYRRDAVKTFSSKRTVRLAYPSIQDLTKELCAKMRNFARTCETFEVLLPYLAWSTDIAFLYLENKRPGLLQDEEKAKAWAHALSSVVEFLPIQKQMPLFTPLVFALPGWLVSAISPDLHRFVAVHKDMKISATHALAANAENSLEDEKTPDTKPALTKSDVYQTIIASNLPPQEKEADRIAQEVFTLIFAGSSSTARVLTRMTFHLASEPAITQQLRQELKTIMADPSASPELEQLEALPYLSAVLKESLRLTRLVSSRSPLISPEKPLHYGAWTIPAKTPTSMTPSSIHDDPSIFPEPYAFRPARWLGAPGVVARLERNFVPFGRGQRICIGMNVAWAQLYLGAATLFRQFDFVLDKDVVRRRDVDVTRDCFLGETSRGSRGVRVVVREVGGD